MVAAKFVTVPEELLSVASLALVHFRDRGYSVTLERRDIDYPATPTFVARRNHAIHFALVDKRINRSSVERWLGYCRSWDREVNLSVCLPNKPAISQADLAFVAENGVVLLVLKQLPAVELSEVRPPRDLSFKGELPKLSTYPKKLRKVIADAHSEYCSGNWQEGFRKACVALEEQSRKYLLRSLRLRGVSYVQGSSTKSPSANNIKKMTLGQMKDVFCGLTAQNQVEADICKLLTRLNPLRIKVTHKPSTRATEIALRKNVGKDMWAILNTLPGVLE